MRVSCSLPNASVEISGVRFACEQGVMVSEEIDDGLGAAFLSITGYQSVSGPKSADDVVAKLPKPRGRRKSPIENQEVEPDV